MRVVLDCNVLISALLGSSICRQVVCVAASRHHIVYSQPTLQEFRAVKQRERLRPYITRADLVLELIRTAGIEVVPAEIVIDVPDEDDEVYLQTAVAGQAPVLVTGNAKHFPLGLYHGVRIMSPREFLELRDNGLDGWDESGAADRRLA